jgi:hypothetical protein
MSKITINYGLPDFTGAFTWEGESSDAAETVEAVETMARSQDLSFRAFTVNCVVQASNLLRDPEVQQTAMMGIIAFVLRQPSGSAENPGLIGDYVDDVDFEITFTSVAGGISYGLHASPTVAGSA